MIDRCIFLAEDDLDDQDIFRQAIREVSDTVFFKAFDDGVELMETLNRNRPLPDVLFLDLNMPRKSGFECLAEIKGDSMLKDIHVVILSTSTHPQNIHYCYKYGAAFYAVKPPDYYSMTKLIKKVLHHDWALEIPKSEFLVDYKPSFLKNARK